MHFEVSILDTGQNKNRSSEIIHQNERSRGKI